MGRRIPSSKTWFASAPKPRPPTSAMWLVAANSATGRPSRKVGVTTVKSLRCPVPSQGSFVMRTSSSPSVSTGKSRRKNPTEAAMALTWPGVPVTACASMRPERSNTPAERSPASRTGVEKAVRTSVRACSSTTDSNRLHMICPSRAAIPVWAPVAAAAPLPAAACRSTRRWPPAATRASQPSGTTVVVWSSAISAGPSTRAPPASPARVWTAAADDSPPGPSHSSVQRSGSGLSAPAGPPCPSPDVPAGTSEPASRPTGGVRSRGDVPAGTSAARVAGADTTSVQLSTSMSSPGIVRPYTVS